MMKNVKRVRLALVCASIILISLMFAGISNAAIDPKTCIGAWLFDEDEDDISVDASGNGRDAVIKDADWTKGKFGTAVELAASSIEIAYDADSLDLNKDRTFSVWFKTDINQDIHARVLHAPYIGGYRLWLFVFRSGHGSKGRLGFGYRAGDIPLEMASAVLVNDDAWHHAVAVFDHKAKQAILYIDGAVSVQRSIAGIDFNNSEEKLCLGSACPGDFLPGIIDESAVFNVALTADDVQDIMNKGLERALGLAPVYPAGKLATVWADVKAE